MGGNRQKGQEITTAEETAGKKNRKLKLTFGKVLALVFGAVAIVYMFFSVQLFYNFIKIMITDPDAAKQQGVEAEASDGMYTDEKE